ncbi:FAD-dependent oxidoreductase [Patescibacteria group bacterium]|nr:FAD-dependent oxidoreductase [Patescibacteria group bacterium]
MYDVIVLGAGAAGLSAALYATRRALKTAVLNKEFGGQTATTLAIENYPGIDKIEGPELMLRFKAQAEKYGAEILDNPASSIVKQNNHFVVTGQDSQTYETKAIILAFGKTPRRLDVSGELEFAGKGVVYCATCDAPLFAGKDVVVVGGGNSAVDAALLLSKIAKQVYLVHRRAEFRAEQVLLERLKQTGNIKLVLNSNIDSIYGEDFVTGVKIKDLITEQTSELSVQGVFVEIGYEVKADFLPDCIKLNEAGEVIIDAFNGTSCPGIFAAGDATSVPYKQTVISAGEGAKAALSAYNYIQGVAQGAATVDHNLDWS